MASPAATKEMALELETIAEEAYVFLYPLVLMDLTRRQMTNVEKWDGSTMAAPMNTFGHYRTYPPLDFRAVVRPNFDTLYSSAWLDLTEEPVIVSLPDSKGRYYLAPTLTMWTDVNASPGWRTAGTSAHAFGYVPPGWTGPLPAGVIRVDSPTRYLWMAGRTQTNGADDYPAVHKFQDGLQIAPLSQFGRDMPAPVGKVDPSVDMKMPPSKQVEAMSAKDFFEYGAQLMKLHPPNDTDYSEVWRLERVGIVPGEDFDFDALGSSTQGMLENARTAGYAKIAKKAGDLGKVANGWELLIGTIGSYGIEYLKRAAVAYFGLGANQIADAYYPVLEKNVGPTSDPYVLHFDKGKAPPAAAFWSITLYDADGFPVSNPIDRGNLASWMDLSTNSDGSIDLYIQPDSPGKDKGANWLPTPKDKAWNLTMRVYAPSEDAVDGKWVPPPLKKAS